MQDQSQDQSGEETFTVHLIDFSESGDTVLQNALVEEGFAVSLMTEEQMNLGSPVRRHPDMIIMRLGCEGAPGLGPCHHLRVAYPHCAMCLIHEGMDEWEETIALELGADAVIPHPAEARRAVAQVRAFQRLKRGLSTPPIPRLQLLTGSRSARVNGTTVYLSDAEYDLLSILVKQAGQAVSRDTICRQIRGLAHDHRDRTIDLRVARLRQKLGDNPHDPVFIRTVRGEGYMLMVGEA